MSSAQQPTEEPVAIHVLGFAGSLRAASYNRALLRAVQEIAPAEMIIDVFDLAAIPLFNADVEAKGDPAAVVEFKQAIRAADAILVVTPEYNHGVPGVLKNAIDWASRPARDSPLGGKPAGIMGASPGMTGSARAQVQLRQAFTFTNSPVMPRPEILVGRVQEKFDADGHLTDDVTRKFIGTWLAAFRIWINRFRDHA